jgi:hypothetical protein
MPPAPPTKVVLATIIVEGRPIRRLAQAEQGEHRRLGLCYNCDESSIIGTIVCASEYSYSTTSLRTTATRGQRPTRRRRTMRLHTSPFTPSQECLLVRLCRPGCPLLFSQHSLILDPRTTSSVKAQHTAPGYPYYVVLASRQRWQTRNASHARA